MHGMQAAPERRHRRQPAVAPTGDAGRATQYHPQRMEIGPRPLILTGTRTRAPHPNLADISFPPTPSSPLQWLGRLVLFALVWLVLVGTDPVSWVIGVPAVLFATVAAARLSRLVGTDPRPLPLLGFVPFFLWESILGGIDVARRVLGPKLLIDPALVSYRPRIKEPAALVAFLDTLSLLPGTLSADFRDDILYVHTLEASPSVLAGITHLEQRIARLFGQHLEGTEMTVHPCGTDALAMARAAKHTSDDRDRA